MVLKVIQKLIDLIMKLRGEALRYVIAGVLTTIVNVSLFTFMTKLLKIAVTTSNVTAISISIVFAYFINKFFVFKKKSENVRSAVLEFTKFSGSRLFTMALEVFVVWLLVIVLKKDELLGKLTAQFFVIAGNYLISKTIVFRRTAR